MKKLILLLCALLPLTAFAQQEAYTPYLEQALKAAKDNDGKKFNTSLRYFSAALDRDNITPATLSAENRKLYVEALFQALSYSNFDISDETAKKALTFIWYDIENNPRQLFALGRLYYYGKGVAQSFTQAKYWYQKAADKGDTWAMNNLGLMYHDGNGATKDYKQARYWFERSAEKGDGAGVSNLGVLFEFGQGVDQDYDKAISYYKKAAGMGEPAGMNKLGLLYEEGKGVDKDYAKAKYWYEKAAEKGNDWAMKDMGELYYFGKGVDEDNSRARYWFEKAAEKGNNWGMYYLGQIYDRGFDVAFDWEQAFQWYKKAADLGNVSALRLAGEFYLFGVGGATKSKGKAMALFEQAKEKGDKKAAIYLQVLRDIGNKKYYELNTSRYGNRIFVEDEPLTAHRENFPWVMTKFGVGWGFDVDYQKAGAGEVQIFPTYINDKDRPDDDISFSNYAPSSPMSEARGSQGYRISWKLERGYRAIGYTYITGYFPNDDNVNIKMPMALCWLPERYYK